MELAVAGELHRRVVRTCSLPGGRSTVAAQEGVLASTKGDTNQLRLSAEVDLLQIENASLEEIIRLVEAENKLLNDALASATADHSEAQKLMVRVHDEVMQTYLESQEMRRRQAVDLVEFVFRSLNARPPPRLRGDSTASARSSIVSARESQRSSAKFVSPLSSVPEAGVPASGSSAISREDKYRTWTNETSVSRYSSLQNVDAPAARAMMPQIRAGRLSVLQMGPNGPQKETFSVWKVNKFRKNSPHLLEIDMRTQSLTVKDVNNSVKFTLTSANWSGIKDLPKDCLEISYTASDRTVVTKKYSFPSGATKARFLQVVGDVISPAVKRSGSVTAVSRSVTVPANLHGDYAPRPLDTSQLELPDDLADVIEGLASNLMRLWQKNQSKDVYEVDDRERVTPKGRLREQLKQFSGGPPSRFQNLSYLLAEALVRDVYELGYMIQSTRQTIIQAPTHKHTQPEEDVFSAEILQLIHKLAVDSNEIWCSMALRSMKRKDDTTLSPWPAVKRYSEGGTPPSPASDANSLDATPGPTSVARPPPASTGSSPPGPYDGTDTLSRGNASSFDDVKDKDSSSTGSRRTTPDNPLAPDGAVHDRSHPRHRSNPQAGVSAHASSQSLVARLLPLGPLEDLPENVKKGHMVDGAEVIRTLHEYGFSVMPYARPSQSGRVPPPIPPRTTITKKPPTLIDTPSSIQHQHSASKSVLEAAVMAPPPIRARPTPV